MKIDVVSLGELVVEIYRIRLDDSLDKPSNFVGPFPSGAPAIFIDCLAKLGCETGFIGPVGEDDFGKCIVEKLKVDGVDTSHIFVIPGYTTGMAFTMYNSDGSRKFIMHMKHAATGQFSPEHVDREYLSQAKHLHIIGNGLVISETMRDALYLGAQILKEAGGKISFDPNLRPELGSNEEVRRLCNPILEKADIILPSGPEAELITGITGIDEACYQLLERGAEVVALKRGKEGSTVYSKQGKIDVVPYKVEEVDPTGAGDCFDAGFVYGLLNNWDYERSAKFANAVAALTVSKKGTMEGDISLSTINELMERRE